MNSTATTLATTAAGGCVISWLPYLELALRVGGSVVAVIAGLLAIVVHIRTIRRGKK